MILEKLSLSLVNVFCPPLAVFLIAGPGTDVVFNCFLFLLAVIPSHIHSFYITSVYFYRKRKVRKGLPPGGPKPMIWSRRILSGGANERQVTKLKRAESMRQVEVEREKQLKSSKRGRRFKKLLGLQGPERKMRTTRRRSGDVVVANWLKEQDVDRMENPDLFSDTEYEIVNESITASPIQNSSRNSTTRGNFSPQMTRRYSSRQSTFQTLPEEIEEQRPQLPERRWTENSMSGDYEIVEVRPPLPQRSQSSRINTMNGYSPWEQSPPLPQRQYSQHGLTRIRTTESGQGQRRRYYY